MTSKKRVTFASMWAFEDIGVQDIDNEIKQAFPHLDCYTEYLKPDEVLVVKGNLGGSSIKIAAVVSNFIEDQTNKDLLDMPRTRQLDMPIVLQDDGASATEEDKPEDLLALDNDSDEELIPHSYVKSRVTKLWLSPDGGIGCFSTGFREFLVEIAAVTGTNIAIIDDLKGIQVSGTSAGDVEDALAKLTRIEKPLSCLGNPKVGNMGIAPGNNATQYRIQNYSSLNKVALRRVLTDPTMNSHFGISQVFVTTCLSFDEKSQSYKLPEDLINPRSISNGPGKSKIWHSFTFQEVGKGHEILQTESVLENNDTNILATTFSVVSPIHPYLTAEKAKQVNKWVAEGNEIEAIKEQPERPSTPPPDSSEDATLVPNTKRGPAIKTRRAISPHSNPSNLLMAPVTKPDRVKTPDFVFKEDAAPTPRRRWKMTYGTELGNTDTRTSFPRPSTPCELRDVADSFVNASMPAGPRVQLPLIFDETKYGLTKPPYLPDSNGRNAPKSQKKGDTLPPPISQNLEVRNLLVDVTEPAAIGTTTLPTIRADQPALIPLSSSFAEIPNLDDSTLGSSALSSVDDLAGLLFQEKRETQNESDCPDLSQATKTAGDKSLLEQVHRLRILEEAFLERTRKTTSTFEAPMFTASFPPSQHDINIKLTKRRLEELERGNKAEDKQPTDEVATREFHHTMNHKAPKPSGRAAIKPLNKAQRQATLEDAWGIPKKSLNKKTAIAPEGPAPSFETKVTSSLHTAQDYVQQTQKAKGELSMNETIEQLFETLKPTLEAAEYFPGSLALEFQIGLALIPILPKTYREGLVSLSEWTRIMQPQTGVSAPTTKFINRVTTSGLDIDHIVDLKTSKKEGNRRMFESEDNEYSVFYEFHCRSKADQPIIVAVDEQGKYCIKKPTEALGAVNIHFPGNIWDARVVVRGNTAYPIRDNQEFEEAAQYMVDHLWVPPGNSLILLFTRLSKEKHLTVEKVLMKRWTRHRYIRADDTFKDIITPDTSSSSGGRADFSTDSVGSTSAKATESITSSDHTESQDIWLQVTEVQDLYIGSSRSDSQALRARCAPMTEMIRRGRQWYEVSLGSSAIEAILKTNANIEVGERTEDWRVVDLFGNDALFLGSKADRDSSSSPRSVARAIGNAGIGDLLRLTKAVVRKMNGVGFWNCGSYVGMPSAGSLNASGIPHKVGISSAMIKVEEKSLDFDELESIKEVGSDGDTPAAKNSNSASSAQNKEQIEKEYW
ncbi:hypothetical protein BDV23DRAFT_137912 [Aspergillus alliaceus]|uniref:Uncharacterized protein n=1 Tax=Petromyces alliaceus TaxID=209559 RepID=A0A5N7BY52_PETAA|nr:hypothetical protein BDV23DRAFT_137912 [Aspergillus alliaceus]